MKLFESVFILIDVWKSYTLTRDYERCCTSGIKSLNAIPEYCELSNDFRSSLCLKSLRAVLPKSLSTQELERKEQDRLCLQKTAPGISFYEANLNGQSGLMGLKFYARIPCQDCLDFWKLHL